MKSRRGVVAGSDPRKWAPGWDEFVGATGT